MEWPVSDECGMGAIAEFVWVAAGGGVVAESPWRRSVAVRVFLHEARSGTTSSLRFRPCLCHFFAKGTVGDDCFAMVLAVPLTFFC